MTNPHHSNSSRTVVVADDDPAWRLLVRLLLEPHGYQLVEASNGVDALRAVHAFTPAVLVLDLMMPRMGGLEVCQRLRTNGAHPLPGIIVITAADDISALPCAADIGADQLLTKPFDLAKLCRAVERLAANWQEFSEPNLLADGTKAVQGRQK